MQTSTPSRRSRRALKPISPSKAGTGQETWGPSNSKGPELTSLDLDAVGLGDIADLELGYLEPVRNLPSGPTGQSPVLKRFMDGLDQRLVGRVLRPDDSIPFTIAKESQLTFRDGHVQQVGCLADLSGSDFQIFRHLKGNGTGNRLAFGALLKRFGDHRIRTGFRTMLFWQPSFSLWRHVLLLFYVQPEPMLGSDFPMGL